MGSNDVPPPNVPAYVVPVSNALLQVSGVLWTLCYVLLTRQSFRDRSYGMPLFALANNFAWEFIYGFFVAEAPLERIVFTTWMLLDMGMVYGLVTYGKEEWNHAPLIKKNLGFIFTGLVVWCSVAHWAFAKWWIDNDVGKREGKYYRGVVGPGTTELGFWSAAVPQIYLSVASLGQLLIRQHTGGVSWGIWGSRALGSVIGYYVNYGWMWLLWREAHEYVMSPFAIVLLGTALVCDLIYPVIFARIRRSERVLPDGRKVAGQGGNADGKKAL